MGLPHKRKRRTHGPEFKTRVAMEAISGRNTTPVGDERVWKEKTKELANTFVPVFLKGLHTLCPFL
jgi:hypothetical protein